MTISPQRVFYAAILQFTFWCLSLHPKNGDCEFVVIWIANKNGNSRPKSRDLLIRGPAHGRIFRAIAVPLSVAWTRCGQIAPNEQRKFTTICAGRNPIDDVKIRRAYRKRLRSVKVLKLMYFSAKISCLIIHLKLQLKEYIPKYNIVGYLSGS